MSGPLAGLRVIDLTNIILGPYTTQIMGDMGADIIKLEAPGGDAMRQVGPARNKNMASIFLNLNRNKRSLVLDLSQSSGLKSFKKLVESADLVIHNLRAKPVAKLGIAYQDLYPLNPALIYCSTIGYRHDGPYGDKAAYDDLIQGISGMASLIGLYQQGAPKYVPTAMVDKTAGLAALNAVLMALFHRERTGEGQEVEVNMFEVMTSYLMVENLWGYSFDPPLGDAGYKRMISPNRKPYATKDGYVCVLPYTDRHWQRFFEIAGRSDLAQDQRFGTLTQRTVNTNALYQLLDEILPERSTAEWLDSFEKADIPCAPVNTLEDLFNDPHLRAFQFFSLVDHPTEGRIRQVGIPSVFSKTPGDESRIPAPRLGEHSVEVLKETGIPEQDIQAMIADGVIFDGR
ncbi:MAG: CoA transferase [SAR324 cluster bacterium]|nr:CoA transferase [SAR324 cluster bacterium]